MPFSQKPITCVLASDRIYSDIDLDLYIAPERTGQIIYDECSSIIPAIRRGCFKHDIERCAGNRGIRGYCKLDETINIDKDLMTDMMCFSDKVIFFWDGTDDVVKYCIDYADSIGIPYRVHIIK